MLDKILSPIGVFISGLLLIAGIITLIVINYEPPISYGTVYYKEYQPYREWIEDVEYCTDITIGNISVPSCHTEEEERSSPDMWFVDIKGENDEGEARQRRVRVTQSLFDKTKIGIHFAVPGETDE